MNEKLYNLFEQAELYPILYVYESEIYCNNIASGIFLSDIEEFNGNQKLMKYGMSRHILDIKKRISSEEKNYKEYRFYVDEEEKNYINLTNYSSLLIKMMYKKYLDEKNGVNKEYTDIYSFLEQGVPEKARAVFSLSEAQSEAYELFVRSNNKNIAQEARAFIEKAELFRMVIIHNNNKSQGDDLERLFSSTIDIAYIAKEYLFVVDYILDLFKKQKFSRCKENALRLIKECPQSNTQSLYIAYFYLALCHEQFGDGFEAESCFKESLRLCEIALKENYHKHVLNTVFIGEALAKYYVKIRAYEKAEEYYQKIINALLKLNCENKKRFAPTLAKFFTGYGDCLYYDDAYKYSVCEQCYNNALDIYKDLCETDNKYLENLATAYYNLSRFYTKRGNTDNIRYIHRGIIIMKQLAKVNPYKYYNTLSQFYIEAANVYTMPESKNKKQMCIKKAEYLKAKYS